MIMASGSFSDSPVSRSMFSVFSSILAASAFMNQEIGIRNSPNSIKDEKGRQSTRHLLVISETKKTYWDVGKAESQARKLIWLKHIVAG